MKENSFANETRLLASKVRSFRITQERIANAVGVDQSQISRILSGKSKGKNELFEKICIYVNNFSGKVNAVTVRKSPELIAALAETWDGTPQHASEIAVVIRSLGVFRERKKR